MGGNGDKRKEQEITLKTIRNIILRVLLLALVSFCTSTAIRYYDRQKKLPYWETAEYTWYLSDGSVDGGLPTIIHVVGSRAVKDYRWDGGPDFTLIYKSDTPAEDLEAYKQLFDEHLLGFTPSTELGEKDGLYFCYDRVSEGEVQFRVRAYLLEDGYKIVYDPYPRTE